MFSLDQVHNGLVDNGVVNGRMLDLSADSKLVLLQKDLAWLLMSIPQYPCLCGCFTKHLWPSWSCCCWMLQESRAAIEDVAVMSKTQLLRRKKVKLGKCSTLGWLAD